MPSRSSEGYQGGISETAVALLKAYDWPGNIRELENQMASAKALAAGQRIEPGHLWSRVRMVQPTSVLSPEASEDMTLREARERFERTFIEHKLKVHRWDLDAAAQGLGLSRSRLYELIRQYGLVREE